MSADVLTKLATSERTATGGAGGETRPRRRRRSLGVVVPLLLLGAWLAMSASGSISTLLLPSPRQVASAAWAFFFADSRATLPGVVPFDGAGGHHIAASLARCLVSFALAVAVGVSVGLALGLVGWVADLLEPTVNALRAIPLYAWLPIALVWFGIGERAARTLIFIGALWPVLITTADSVARVPRAHIETARMLGTPARRLWRRVYLPSALPEIVTGLRLSMTLAWMCVIVGELTGTASGVGAMMNAARESGRIDEIVVGMLVFAVIGLLADVALRTMARPFVRWSWT